MELNLEPVKVDFQIETPSLERGAFYSLCFITENDEAPRTLIVERLKDLLDNGYDRSSLAYNFCVGVFAQQGIPFVYVRAKRSSESYIEAYNSDDNSMYYFVVLQTKDLIEVEEFNNHLVIFDEMKLQFFSQNVGSKILQSPKLVNYYQDYTPSDGVPVESKDYYLNKAYGGSSEDGSGGDFNPIVCTPTAPMPVNLDMPSGTTNVYARYRVNGGAWQTYTSAVDSRDSLDEYFIDIQHPEPVTQNLFNHTDGVNKDVLNSFLFNDYKDGNGFRWGDSDGNLGYLGYNEDIQFPLPSILLTIRVFILSSAQPLLIQHLTAIQACKH